MIKNQIHLAHNSVYGENQKGFSLIELLIAMAILAMAMLAAASMQFNSVRNTTNGNIFTQANMLAKGKMEELKNTRDLITIDGGGADNGINAEGQPGGIYNLSWTVANLGSSARRITVTVQWNRGSQSRRISISSNTRGNGV
jgi:prepilin-type N-terminal cleavage/methylation domain-containing protein